ncbi:MAG: PQQ-binding-like beta-propeller repeat protein [Phycisphaerales bacterium]|nr:PQQ-binding-like beta-propeller repeat protein [Phycisphaerales bacterium]
MLLIDSGGNSASTLALNKTNGDTIWSSGSDETGYSSPLVIDNPADPAKRLILMFKGKAIVAKDPGNGRELWRYRWATSYNVNASMPLVQEGKLFLTTGYGQGSVLLNITGPKPVEVWRNKEMSSQVASPVLLDGFAYGFDGQVGRGNTVLKCLDLATGNSVWEHPGLGAGTLISADGKLIVLSEKGELLIAPASKEGFKPTARASLLKGTCWVSPSLAHGRLYLRSNLGDMLVLDVK